jgi:hypothetical protein
MLLDDIARLIEDAGIGIEANTVFKGSSPLTPTNCITVIEYQGAKTYRGGSGVMAEQPRVQVSVRNSSYEDARALAEAIYQELDGTSDTIVNDTRYLWIEALSPPAYLGQNQTDQSNSFRVVTNFAVIKERTEL